MAKISPDAFLNLLQRSALFDAERLETLLRQMDESGIDVQDSASISDWMVSNSHLTEWQAGKLRQGKHKGFRLGKYRLRDMLGKGGMSSVYLAEHTLMRRECAIKVLPIKKVKDSSYLARFHREAQAVAALDHPNIVRAYDIDHEKDKGQEIHFLVMEYVKGRNLHEMVKETGPLSYEAGAEFCRQAALGLDHAHQAGLVHRDVKPGNLLLDDSGTVKILDLGLARFAEVAGSSEASLTVAHEQKVLGTPDYLSPEQALDSHMVDSRADIYSLGCSMYFALTGQPPFNEGSIAQRLMWHQMKEPDEMSKVRSGIPDGLAVIVRKMMAKKPDDRYPAMADVASILLDWLTKHASREWQQKHVDVLSSSGPAPTALPVSPDTVPVSAAVPTALEILPGVPLAVPVEVPPAALVSEDRRPASDRPVNDTRVDQRQIETVELAASVALPEVPQLDSVFGAEETDESSRSSDTLPSDGVPAAPSPDDEEAVTAVLTGVETGDAESVEIVVSEGTRVVPAELSQGEEPVPGSHVDAHPLTETGLPDGPAWNVSSGLPDVLVTNPLDPIPENTEEMDFLQNPPVGPDLFGGTQASDLNATAPLFPATPAPVPVLSPSAPPQSIQAPLDLPGGAVPVSDGSQSGVSGSGLVTPDGLDSGSISISTRPGARRTSGPPVGLLLGILVTLAIAGGIFWWQSRDTGGEIAGGETQGSGKVQNGTGAGGSTQGGTSATGTTPEFLGYQLTVGPEGNFPTFKKLFSYLKAARLSYRGNRGQVIRVVVAGGTYRESLNVDNTDHEYPGGIHLIADERSPVVLDPDGTGPVIELTDVDFWEIEGFVINADGCENAIVLSGVLARCTLNQLQVFGYSRTGIRLQGARGLLEENLTLNQITFKPAGENSVGIEFTGGYASRTRIENCRFRGPQNVAVAFEKDGAKFVEIVRSVIERARIGILLDGKEIDCRYLSIAHNTFHDCSQAGIHMANAPLQLSTEVMIHRNLFSKLGGAEVFVAQGYDLKEFQQFTSTGNGGLQCNWSDRPSSANQTTEWEVVLRPEQRIASFQFVSTDVDSPEFLSPQITFTGFRADSSSPDILYPGAVKPR